MKSWTLEEAGPRLEELARAAREEGPQRVLLEGSDGVVVLSLGDYERLADPGSIVKFLRTSPLAAAMADGSLGLERALVLEEITRIQAFVASLPDRDTRTPDEVLGHDDHGLPG